MNTHERVIQDLRVIQALSNRLDDLKKKNQALERKKQALNKGPLKESIRLLPDGKSMKKIMEAIQSFFHEYGCDSVTPHNS